MMEDVQGAHVLRFLAHNEEEGVEELRELGEVIPPSRVGHP